MAAKSTSSRAPDTTNSQVSRKLFHKHLSRRPTSTSTSTSATTLQESPQDNTSDIVVRDHNGNYSVDVLPTPPIEDDQAAPEDPADEKEKLEARLLEMYRNRSIQPGDTPELLSVVQASLRRKVDSLDEDNWMFEAEEETPG